MNHQLSFFLPTRKGSERVKNKNTRDFAGIKGGLLALKLKQLINFPMEAPIILSTNDAEAIEIAGLFNSERIKIIARPEELCLSSTVLSDLIQYIPGIISTDNIFWVHTTEPFVDEHDYYDAYQKYLKAIDSGINDSLMGVTKVQEYLWDKEANDFVSHDRQKVKWPRTQDITPLYSINSTMFINSRQNYLKFGDRIGNNPFLYEMNKIKSFDIDWQEDFELAEMMYEKKYNRL